MVDYENELANLLSTKNYVDFGIAEVGRVNDKFRSWLAQQSFAGKTISSEFEKVIVGGYSDYTGDDKREWPDKIQWNLRFADKIEDKGLSDALFREKRYSNIPPPNTNSKPQLFSTADYIEVRVTNGERGWVKKGEFPVNIRIEENYDTEDRVPLDIPIQTDVRREALAGFESAHQWQKFRAMAEISSYFIKGQLADERKNVTDYDSEQDMRSRIENVYPFFLQLLPNTEGALALKPFYKPGVLEGALALGLEHAVYHQFGSKFKGRPIYTVKGHPIETTQTNNGYDALMSFDVQMSNSGRDDEEVRVAIENQLAKHYAIRLETPTKMMVALELKDAHNVAQQIRNNAIDTKLHKFTRNFRDALKYTNDALRTWHGEIPVLKKEYEERINYAREAHFSTLGKKFR